MSKKKGKVTGLGGIFFKSTNPEELKKWYSLHLGLETDQFGHMFKWLQPDKPDQAGYTQWSVFDSQTSYLDPSGKDFMINYRVENLRELVAELKENGMEVVGEIEEYEYGLFAWVMDPEGHKIELWEPVNEVFTSQSEQKEQD